MDVIKQINENGLVPKNVKCPFLRANDYLDGCPKNMCLHERNKREIDFSCGMARAFAICYNRSK